jgi:hypothetical protein
MGEFAVYEAFSPLDYLHSYYGQLDSEADGLLNFLVEQFEHIETGAKVLEFGGGPTLIGLIPAARKAASIHFCDYVVENRQFVERWLAGDEHEFDWHVFVERCLQFEGIPHPDAAQIEARCELIRSVVGPVTSCDVYQRPPIQSDHLFDVVITNYCLDAVTNDIKEWHQHIETLKQMLQPGGLFIMSSLKQATYSDFGETRYPNVYLLEDDVRTGLIQAGFAEHSIRIATAPADHESREYRGVIFAAAQA